MRETIYINVEDGLKRVMNNRNLYIRLLTKFKSETNADELFAFLESGDYEKAREAAHTLKGVAGNLALSELYKQVLDVETRLKAGAIDTGAISALRDCLTGTVKQIDEVIAGDG